MKGKAFGPPPEKGPQPQGMNGGRLVEPKLKKRKKYGNRSKESKTRPTKKGLQMFHPCMVVKSTMKIF